MRTAECKIIDGKKDIAKSFAFVLTYQSWDKIRPPSFFLLKLLIIVT